MAKELIKISMTEFMNFVNKSGIAKSRVVENAKSKREDEYEHYKDYWLKLRERLKSIHRTKGCHDHLRALLAEVSLDKRANYSAAIEGYIKFWKKKKIEWVRPPRKTWSVGDIRIELNPELGLVINDRIYIIKLFFSVGVALDKRHADLILNLMEKELRERFPEEDVVFAVLDVKRGKLFVNDKRDTSNFPLLLGEAQSFEVIWKHM